MNKAIGTKSVIWMGVLIVMAHLAANTSTRVQDTKHLPEKITPLTTEQLNTKVPHFYCFEYKGEPQPGKRYWLRISNKRWFERYPDGVESTFRVLGHTTVNDIEGTIVVKVEGDQDRTGTDNAGGLQAFIPDKGSKVMHHLYRNTARGDTAWQDLGQMLSVE